MSESEIAQLRAMIQGLSEKADRQHAENLLQMAQEREAFTRAINEQRNAFQNALNTQHLEHTELVGKVNQLSDHLRVCIGEGQPGQGRLGAAELAIEKLKKFMWQATAVIAMLLLLAQNVARIYGK